MADLDARPGVHAEFVAPRNKMRTWIQQIWQELLGIEQIGMHDDFWELGGHSLLGQQVMARIQEATHIDPPLLLLFEAPTIEKLSASISALIVEEVQDAS